MPNQLLVLNQQSKVWLILVSLWIINGSSFLAIKVAIDTIPPLLSAGLRFSISGAILLAVYFFQIKLTREKKAIIFFSNIENKNILNQKLGIKPHYLRIHLHENILLSNNGKTDWFLD
jgi:hypothetical protein